MTNPTGNQERAQQQKQQPEKGDVVPALSVSRELLNVQKLDTESEPGNRVLAALVSFGCYTFNAAGPERWLTGDDWLDCRFDRLAATSGVDVLHIPTVLAFLEAGGYIRTERCGPVGADCSVYVRLNLGAAVELA